MMSFRTDDSGFTQDWLLTEFYADPGDGSGTFEPVMNSHVLRFNSSSNVVTISEDLCSGIAMPTDP